jgi:adenylyltransferase/sulfurtransferase
LDQPHYIVLGVGGLGCPALLGLSAAGARSLTLVDPDAVDDSNLQRQVLFRLADVGVPKVRAAAHRLRARLPAMQIREVAERVDARTLERLLAEAPASTVVLECSDDPELKFLVNDACVARGIPAVIAGVIGWTGQAMAVAPGHACFRCVYETPPPRELAPACSAVGIVGATAGHLGQLMALLAVRMGSPELPSPGGETNDFPAGSLISIDLLSASTQTLRPGPRPGCTACACAPANSIPRLEEAMS